MSGSLNENQVCSRSAPVFSLQAGAGAQTSQWDAEGPLCLREAGGCRWRPAGEGRQPAGAVAGRRPGGADLKGSGSRLWGVLPPPWGRERAETFLGCEGVIGVTLENLQVLEPCGNEGLKEEGRGQMWT